MFVMHGKLQSCQCLLTEHVDEVACPQPEKLTFRQRPVFEDCFPSSTKQYKEVEHENGTLQVGDSEHAYYHRIKLEIPIERKLKLTPTVGLSCRQVPFRRIKLTGDNGVFDVYDTSGPQARLGNYRYVSF